jgi:glucose-6-phosphate isomerase
VSEFRFDYTNAEALIGRHELDQLSGQAAWAHDLLHRRGAERAAGLGWLQWPETYDVEEFRRLEETAARIRDGFDAVVVVGIGGSYLGAKAAMAMLGHAFHNQLPRDRRRGPEMYFAGHQLGSLYMAQLLDMLEGKDFAVIVVSKSGTTTEPAAAFRLLRDRLEQAWGKEEAARRIFVVTDPQKGALRAMAERIGYTSFAIPPDVGGRYSVLTPAGLLPIAASGIDINEMMRGARSAMEDLADRSLEQNPALQYAVIRNLLYRKGMAVELFVSYEPSLAYFAEWWKQLFGESEGKDGKGLFPASAQFTTDLHSLGQYIQEGRRHLFETVLRVNDPGADIPLPSASDDGDGLGFLAGRTLEDINRRALEGTVLAHVDGGVPNLIVDIPALTPYWFGYLVYFFEKSCALSGMLLGVNPFDQPGVEAYKTNMFALLGKPGYEEQRARLEERLGG